MMGGGLMNGFGGFGTFGLIGMILNLVITIGLIVGIVALVLWLVRKASASNGQPSWNSGRTVGLETPREILQTRYARGEITREQFQQMLADLS